MLIIRREGGYLVRYYVDLGELTPGNREAIEQITVDRIIETAQRILHPYSLNVQAVAWFSGYEVGQCLTDRFDDALALDGTPREPCVFIAGDPGFEPAQLIRTDGSTIEVEAAVIPLRGHDGLRKQLVLRDMTDAVRGHVLGRNHR